MAVPWAAILSAAGGASGGILGGIQSKKNRKFQADQNRLDREFQNTQLERTIIAGRENWEMQQDYNRPANQMQRLREAGLNPHLVYGEGANSIAFQSPTTAGSVSAPNQPAQQSHFAENAEKVVNSITDLLVTTSQIENLKSSTENNRKDLDVKDADIIEKLARASKTKAEREQIERLKDLVVENMTSEIAYKKAMSTKIGVENEYTKAETIYVLGKNEREALLNAAERSKILQDIAESKARILLQQAQTAKTYQEKNNLMQEYDNIIQAREKMKNETAIKAAEKAAAKNGVLPTDPWYFRTIVAFLTSFKTGNTRKDEEGQRLLDKWHGR